MQYIKHIRYFPYRIPFRTAFTTAHGILTMREGAIVEITTNDDLTGIGEIAPMPEFAGDDLRTALAPLPLLSSQLLGWELLDALNFLYTDMPDLPATTLCGLESALLDSIGKFMGCSVMDALGHMGVVGHMGAMGHMGAINRARTGGVVNAARTGVSVNGVIGALSIENTVARALEAMQVGYSCIKLKVRGGHLEAEVERIAAVRAAIGSEMHLRLDANAGWTFAEAVAILSRCAPYAIQYVEQPLPAADLDGMHILRYNVPVPIAADEAVYDLESARRVLAHDAAAVLIIKPQLAGGLRVGRQIISAATQHGVQCVITSTLESGVGIAGALHLAAASSEVTLECGLATLHLLADDLLIDDLTLDHGFFAVPAGPGLGIHLDRNALAY
jgi:L-alanine-DL-glutamate epimerase-like enolase superfamily enzyme